MNEEVTEVSSYKTIVEEVQKKELNGSTFVSFRFSLMTNMVMIFFFLGRILCNNVVSDIGCTITAVDLNVFFLLACFCYLAK